MGFREAFDAEARLVDREIVQNLVPRHRMIAHQAILFLIEPSRFQEYGVRDCDLAQVMHASGKDDRFRLRDPDIAALFCKPEPDQQDLSVLAEAFASRLSDAESELDRIAEQARTEANLFSVNPTPLLALVDQTRRLSVR